MSPNLIKDAIRLIMMKPSNRIFATLTLIFLVACANPSTLPAPTPTQIDQGAANGKVISIQDMTIQRAAHTATRLPNGKVLITGGFNGNETPVASTEMFDPASNTFSASTPMSFARQLHTATLLKNGKVLIAGGYGDGDMYLDRVELYDPLTDTFTPAGQMTIPRAGHIATLLTDGTVLIAGGTSTGWTFVDSAEIYDPIKGTFTPTGHMTVAREAHIATLLKDGKVLIIGGHNGRRSSIIIYASAELYDPVSRSFTPTVGTMLTRRHKHDAVALEDGRVLVVGGADENDDRGQYISTEIYDPHTGIFTMAGNMNTSRYKFQGTSILMQTGKVLLMGGASITEIYDPETNIFQKVMDGVGTTRLFASATSLPDGRVLLAGGYGTDISSSANAWVFQP
jgi:N-acetylneuraminic acid mutarotase